MKAANIIKLFLHLSVW